jgi:hypothetical protein
MNPVSRIALDRSSWSRTIIAYIAGDSNFGEGEDKTGTVFFGLIPNMAATFSDHFMNEVET